MRVERGSDAALTGIVSSSISKNAKAPEVSRGFQHHAITAEPWIAR
jgi:hypothetical protein